MTSGASATEQRPMPEVEIHTDGSARGNPGPGGYGVVLRYGEHSKELSGGFKRTTNNRMELLAVIVALEALKFPCRVKLFSDSKYVVEAIRNSAPTRWQSKGWRRHKKRPVKNVDLWERYLEAVGEHELEATWIEGHAGHVDNERCDALATGAAQSDDLQDDTGFGPSEDLGPILFPVTQESEHKMGAYVSK